MTEERTHKACAGRASWPIMASIALNLFLVGVVIAPFLHDDRGAGAHNRPPPGPGALFEHIARDLPPKDADALRKILDAERTSFMPPEGGARETQRALADALRAPAPDDKALGAALEGVRAAHDTMHAGMTRLFMRIAKEISPEGRQRIAAILKDGPPPMAAPQGGPPQGGMRPREDRPPPPR